MYYPESYLCGYNFKAWILSDGGIATESVEVESCIPEPQSGTDTTTQFMFNINKSYMDYVNGTGVETVVPAISGDAVHE